MSNTLTEKLNELRATGEELRAAGVTSFKGRKMLPIVMAQSDDLMGELVERVVMLEKKLELLAR